MKPRRNSLRLSGYDYGSPGAYFITVSTARRLPLFGTVRGDAVELTRPGRVVADQWRRSGLMWPGVGLDEFIVMPDHFHAIVWLDSDYTVDDHHGVGADCRPPYSGLQPGLPSLVRGFKSAVTSAINTVRGTPGVPVWQRGYYDRVIRNERELDAARLYVRFNVEKCLMVRVSRAHR